jgi:hypothetical protein
MQDRRSWQRVALGLALFLVLGVGISHQFPALTGGPRSSAELLEELFEAPVRLAIDPARFFMARAGSEAVVLFVRSCDLPPAAEGRLVAHLEGETFRRRTLPFLFYLYELYGAGMSVEASELEELAYAEPLPEPPGEAAREEERGGPGLSRLVRRSARLRANAAVALRLYDALFLQLEPGREDAPVVRDRYSEASYEEIKKIVRDVARATLLKEDRAGEAGEADEDEQADYLLALEEILEDDERLSVFIQFFTDAVRQLSDSWLSAFLDRQQRRERRLEWVRGQLAANRHHRIADWARARSRRRLVLHLAVDGLQGQLLEGLAQLSAGDRQGQAARFVAELARLHRTDVMGPARYDSGMPPPLGDEVQQLVDEAPDRPGYLRNFKRTCFDPAAPCVIVHVATVDTPSISIRNLPIIQTGHGPAGPHGTGIPNFSYLDRATGLGWYFWGSDVLFMPEIFANREERIPGGRRRVGGGARTLFERLWRYNTVSYMATLDEGALEKISAEVGLVAGELQRNFTEKVMVLRLRRRAAMERELDRRRRWLADHRRLSGSFLGSLLFDARALATFREHAEFLARHEDEGLPDYLLWYNPWPDHFAHGSGPYADEILGFAGEYDRLDFYLGKIIRIYEESAYADRTLFGVVSDHGLIYTPRLVSTDELLFRGMEADGLRVRYQKLTHDEGGLPALRDRGRVRPSRPYDAVVGSTAGGSYIIDLFDPAGLAGDEAAWRRHPGYHQLTRHTLLSGQPVDWIAQLRDRLRDSMDLALVREYGPEPGSSWPPEVASVVRVVTADRGDVRVIRLLADGREPRYRYEVLDESDPLDLVGAVRDYLIAPGGPPVEEARASLEACIDAPRGCPEGEWRRLLSYTLRPDVVHQFSRIYDSDRAGTVNVFPLRHVGMNSSVPGRHAGEAFGEKNGTQIYWGAGLARARLQTARNGSLPVTLYHWLVGDEEFRRPDLETGTSPAEEFAFATLLGCEGLRGAAGDDLGDAAECGAR